MKEQTKQKLKKGLFKGLNITCYIISALTVLSLLIVGLQSCKPAKQVSADEPLILDLQATQWTFSEHININHTETYDVVFSLESGTQWQYLELDANSNYMFYYDYVVYGPDGWEDNNYRTVTFISGSDLTNDVFIEWLYNNATLNTKVTYFDFNKVFNYNAPMGQSLASPYGMGASWTQEYSSSAVLDIDLGLFISNGEQFTKIRYRAFKGDSLEFKIANANGIEQYENGPAGSWSYMFLEYVYANGQSIVVNSRDSSPYVKSNGGYAFVQENSATWQIDAYRHIAIIGDISVNNKNALDKFNNNNQTSYNGTTYNNETNSVFTLLGSAFTGLLPILSVSVLPGVTIGILLFIPLVVTIIFAIIKIIKK